MEEMDELIRSVIKEIEPADCSIDDLGKLVNMKCKLDQKKVEEVESEKEKKDYTEIFVKSGTTILCAVMSYIAYDRFQKRMTIFESTGRITSFIGRELHMPRIF